MQKIRWNNELIDNALIYRNIKRIEDYKGSIVKHDWKCLICNHVWNTSATHILNDKSGCPKCSNSLKLTPEIINERLKGKILLVDEYLGNSTKVLFQCNKCNYQWKTQPDHVLNSGSGCPICSFKEMRLTNEDIDNYLKGSKIIRLEDYVLSKTKIKFKCLVCYHEWKGIAETVYRGRNCPNCKKTITGGERLVTNILESKGLIKNKDFITEKKLQIKEGNIFVDFYIPKSNTIIEYNGEQHYKPVKWPWVKSEKDAQIRFVKQQNRDSRLRDYCSSNFIKLIEIPYTMSQKEINTVLEGVS